MDQLRTMRSDIKRSDLTRSEVKRSFSLFSLARHITLTGLTGLFLSSALSAWASDGLIRSMQYDPNTHHFMIDATGPVRAVVNTVNIAGHKRVIVDVDNAEISNSLPKDSQLLAELTQQMPGLRNVTVNQYGGNGRPVVRILLDIESDSQIIRLIRNQGPRLELEVAESALAQPQQAQQSSYSSSREQGQGAAPTPVSQASNNGISQATYQQTLQTLAQQKKQIDALMQQVSQLRSVTEPTPQPTGPSLDEMKRTLVTMNLRYDQLMNDNRNLKSQLIMAQSQSKLANSDTVLTAKQAEVDRLKQDVQNLRRQVQQAQISKQATNTPSPALDEMQRTLVDLNKKYDALLIENQRMKSEKAAAPTTSEIDLQGLRKQLGTAQQSLNQSIQTINEQNKEIAYLRNQVTDVKAGLSATSQAQLSQLRVERDAQETQIRDLEQQLATAKSKSGATALSTSTAEEMATLKRQLSQVTLRYQASIDDLNRQLTAKNQQLQDRGVQLNDAQDSSQQNLNQLQEQVRQLKSELSATEQKAYQAQAIANRLQTSAISPLEIQKRDSQIRTLQGEVSRLKASVTAVKPVPVATGQNNAVLKSLELKAANVDRLTQENQTLKTKIAGLESAKLQLETQKQSANKTDQNKYAALQAQLEQLGQENQSLKTQLANQPKPVAVNTDGFKNEIARLTEENQALKAKQAAVPEPPESNNNTAPLQTKIADLQGALDALKAQYDRALSDSKQARQELESQKKVMMATKPAATGGSAVLQKQVTDLNRQLADLKKENTTLRDRVSSAVPQGPASANPEAEEDYTDAKAALAGGQLEQALEKYKEAQLLEPDTSRYTVDYSIALSQNHEYAQAADLLRRYLSRNPGDREAYGQLGKVYLLNDQTDMAAQALSSAIPIGTLNNYATALKKLGKNEDAENIFKMALKINPNDVEVLFNLGNLYNATERLELARNSYLQALQIKPDFAEAHYNVGLLYSKLGDRAKAVSHLEKYLQLSPNARNAETLRAFVEKLKA